MKIGSKNINTIKNDKNNIIINFLLEMKYLFTNWKYLLPFTINMSGSFVFYKTLASADLSLVVPITNSLTFIFTHLMSQFLGEIKPNKYQYIGIVFIMWGIYVCMRSAT